MSPLKTKRKQRSNVPIQHPSERRQTRGFAKENRIEVPNLSLDDLDAITRRNRAPRRRSPPTRSVSDHGLLTAAETEPQTLSQRSKKPTPAANNSNIFPETQTGISRKTQRDRSITRRLETADLARRDKSRNSARRRTNTPQRAPDSHQSGTVSQEKTLVSTWLSSTAQTDFSDPEEPKTPPSQSDFDGIDTMDTSSSLNTSSTNENTAGFSTKASTVRKATANTFMEHLEFRGITDVPSEDNLLLVHDITENLLRESSIIKCRQLNSLIDILNDSIEAIQDSINEKGSDDGFLLYDSLREKILDWKPESAEYRRFPPGSARHFDWDKTHCNNSNEADFQRTIMMEIIDRYDFRDKFAFSCEEMWSVESQFLIKPSRKNSAIKQPKPDLAISFQRNAIKKSRRLDYPIELRSCLHPGNKGRERWFPFLFLEAKRDDASLRDALESNLLNASQALFNIYQWMRQLPELEQQFFDKIRVMTITLNNQNLTLRMHRAEKTEGDYLQFEFTVLREILGYSRFEACHLIKSILVDFAVPHLLPIFADTYDRVAKIKVQSPASSKRKQTALGERDVERQSTRLASESIGPESIHGRPSESTGNSFAMGQMGVSELSNDGTADPTTTKPLKRSRRDKNNGAVKGN